MLKVLFVLAVVGAIANGETVIREYQAMYRVVPTTEEHLQQINSLVADPKVVIWSPLNSIGQPVDLLITLGGLQGTIRSLRHVGLNPSLVDNSVKIKFSVPYAEPAAAALYSDSDESQETSLLQIPVKHASDGAKLGWGDEYSCKYSFHRPINWDDCRWSGCYTYFMNGYDACKEYGSPIDGSGLYFATDDSHGSTQQSCFLSKRFKCCRCAK